MSSNPRCPPLPPPLPTIGAKELKMFYFQNPILPYSVVQLPTLLLQKGWPLQLKIIPYGPSSNVKYIVKIINEAIATQ